MRGCLLRQQGAGGGLTVSCFPVCCLRDGLSSGQRRGRTQVSALRGRARRGKKDRLDAEKRAFHEDVYRGYLQLEEEYPDRIVGIDASGSIEEIREEICRKLEEVLKRVTE